MRSDMIGGAEKFVFVCYLCTVHLARVMKKSKSVIINHNVKQWAVHEYGKLKLRDFEY